MTNHSHSKKVAAASLVLALVLVGCPSTSGGGEPGSDDESREYENHVYFNCNGTVLVDRTFTSRAACESFADDFGVVYCGSTKFQVSC